MIVHASYNGNTLHMKMVRHKNSGTGLLVSYCSPMKLEGRIPDTSISFSILHLNHVLATFSFLTLSVLCFSVQWNLLSICSLTFLNSFLYYFVFKLHGKFLYVAYSLRETLIVVWVFWKWQCKTINMYDVFFWCTI